MELTIYDILQGPVVSDKAYRINQTLKKLVVEVHVEANKPLIAEAVEKLFDVKVASVRTVVRKGKRRMSRKRNVSNDKTIKRAYITLKEGYDVNLFGNVGMQTPVQQAPEQAASVETSKQEG